MSAISGQLTFKAHELTLFVKLARDRVPHTGFVGPPKRVANFVWKGNAINRFVKY